LTNVAQYVHTGAGKIVMTETGNTNDMWTTQVSSKPTLNGVTTGVTKLSGNTTAINSELLDVMMESLEAGYVTKMVNGELYRADDSKGICRYNSDEKKWRAKNRIVVNGGHIKDFDVVPNGNTGSVTCYSIVEGTDNQTYLYRNSSAVATLSDANGSTNGSNGYGLPSDVKSIVRAGDIMYYATAKTLGWERVRD